MIVLTKAADVLCFIVSPSDPLNPSHSLNLVYHKLWAGPTAFIMVHSFNRPITLASRKLLADQEIDMVLAIMVIPWEAVRNFKTTGFRVRDWFGDVASIREQYPDKPLVSVVIGYPEYLDDMASLCGRSVPIFTSPEAAAQALAALWSYSKVRKKSGEKPDI